MIESPNTNERTPVQIFQETCKRRLDELVEQEIFSQEYAADRMESAMLIEQGLSDPEKTGLEFAEIGLDAMRQFNEQIENTIMKLTEQIQSAETLLLEVIDSMEDAGAADIVTNKIRSSIQNLKQELEIFKEKAESVKGGKHIVDLPKY